MESLPYPAETCCFYVVNPYVPKFLVVGQFVYDLDPASYIGFVVGDVHGCLEEFRELLKLLSFSRERDRLVQVGDLMDRGPDPIGCVRFARELGATVLMGNHEDKHVRWRKHEAVRAVTGKKNPMKFSPNKIILNESLPDDIVQWMFEMPLTLDLGDGFVVTHAGLEPAHSFADQGKAVLRVRYVDDKGKFVGFKNGTTDQPEGTAYWTEKWKGPESVIYGHARHSHTTPRVDTFPGGRCFGIDTGCVFGGKLTAAILVSGQEPEFVQVDARRTYADVTLYEDGNA